MDLLDGANEIVAMLARELAALKHKGFEPKPDPAKPKKVKAPEPSDEMIVRARDKAAIDRMTADFTKQGHSPAAARKEAERIRSESTRTTVHPSG